MPAQMILSEMYAKGEGVAKDPVQSLEWALKVAMRPGASPFWVNKAADILYAGWDTVPKNYPLALKLYQGAAIRNDPHALLRLGQMYQDGLGITPDPARAHIYLARSAALGNTEAKALLSKDKQNAKQPQK
jgi:TPR repeat protein